MLACEIRLTSLCDLRKSRKLNQTELGKILGVSQRTISNYEKGNTQIPAQTAERIKAYFGLTINGMWEVLYKRAEERDERACPRLY